MEKYNKRLFDKFMMGIAAVNVRTKEEYNQFMQLLEDTTDLNWMGGGEPTSKPYIWDTFEGGTCIYIWDTLEDGTCIFRYDFGSKDGLTCKYSANAAYMGYQIIAFSDLMNEKG